MGSWATVETAGNATVRLAIALFVSMVVGAISVLADQGGVHVARSGGRPNGPTRSLRPNVRPPLPPKSPVGSVPPRGSHRPIPFQSSFFGLVVFDPFWYWAPDVADPLLFPAPPTPSPRLMGGLQLEVEPRRALVYVDGFFVGLVDNFRGYYHHLDVGVGWHLVELVAPDYDPLITTVAVAPGQTTTYRGSLNRVPGRN